MSLFDMFKTKSKIKVNGVIYEGNSLTVLQILVDGKDVTPKEQKIDISVEGNLEDFKVSQCNKVTIKGNTGNIDCSQGDVEITGNTGTVKCSQGKIKITGNVTGDVKNSMGDITIEGELHGNAKTSMGDINRK